MSRLVAPAAVRSGSRVVAVALTAALTLCLPAAAAAYDNDLALWKLGAPDELSSANPVVHLDPLAQEKFARFASELALAIAPQPVSPANSLGDAGFEITFSADLAMIHPLQALSGKNAQGVPVTDSAGKAITSGGVWPLEQYADMAKAPASATLFIPTLHFRKGLPFSLEADASFGYITLSHMSTAGAALKWAVVEGFQWWPDIAARAFATVLLGSGPLTLVVTGWDVGGGYRFPLFGDAEVSLYGGFQMLGVNASTHNIDFDPQHENARDPTSDDTVFSELSLGSPLSPTTAFARGYFGLRVRKGVLVVGADASDATGTNVIGKGSDYKVSVQTGLWKASAYMGVQF
jgi:hypothetical protein